MEYKTVDELKKEASKYEYVKAMDLVQVFKDNHIYFPDFVHRFILQNLLKKYIFAKETMATYTDEYYYKLRAYNYFSVHLLERAISEHNLNVPAHEYKNLFMRFFLKNEKKFKNSIALEKGLSQLTAKQPTKEESIQVVLKEFTSIFYTPKGYLDGISLSILKESVVESYNLVELRELGEKYGVTIPRRANKAQLIALISERFRLSDEEITLLEGKSTSEICQYAKSKGFKISNDLKKQDMVEFIIFSLKKYHEDTEKDLYNYDIISPDELLVDESVEETSIEVDDQSLPTSNEFVDAPTEFEEVKEDIALEEETLEETVEDTPQEEAIEEKKEEEPLVEETKIEEEITPVKEETKEEAKPQEIEEAPEVYYDDTVDQEIRDVIKKYYAKKNHKDRGFRWTVVLLLFVIILILAFFVLNSLGIINL